MSDEPDMVVIGRLGNGAAIRGDAGFIKLITRQHEYEPTRDVCLRCGRTALQIVENGLRCDEVQR